MGHGAAVLNDQMKLTRDRELNEKVQSGGKEFGLHPWAMPSCKGWAEADQGRTQGAGAPLRKAGVMGTTGEGALGRGIGCLQCSSRTVPGHRRGMLLSASR